MLYQAFKIIWNAYLKSMEKRQLILQKEYIQTK